MKVVWQDAFTTTKTGFEAVKKDIKDGVGITETHGEVVYENKKFIILRMEKVRGIRNCDNFLTVPKGLILNKWRR